MEFFSNYKGKLFGTAAWRRMIGKPESLVTLFFFYILCSLLTSDRNVSPDIRKMKISSDPHTNSPH